jgi:antitoxin VapB
MMTAKVFENGRSQAVRLPKEYRFKDDEVMINKVGDVVLLVPKSAKWETFMRSLDMFSPDFLIEDRGVQYLQEREKL